MEYLLQGLYNEVQTCCAEHHCLSADELPQGANEQTRKKAYKLIHRKKGFELEMLSYRPIKRMIEQTAQGFNTVLNTPIAERIPTQLRERLENDIYIFSGFKTYHNLREASMQLIGNNGLIKPFDQFLQDIRAIDAKYNENWLNAEYRFAINTASMASHWAEFMKDADSYDLQYVTVGDSAVRPEHAALEGLTLPTNDPFWRTGTPPNGWGCRCTLMQVPKTENKASKEEIDKQREKASQLINTYTAGKNKIFRFNPYFDEAIFPPTHPYFSKRGYRHCVNNNLAINHHPSSYPPPKTQTKN